MIEQAEAPPPGFQITEGGDGRWTVRYCPGRIGWHGLALWARLLWEGISFFLVAVGGVVHYVLWALVLVFEEDEKQNQEIELWTVSSFAFGLDELVVVRSLFAYRRRKEFRQGEVRSVVQVQEGDAPFWTLEVTSGSRVKVLTWQPMASSQWLGSRIAQWAGVPLETLKREKPEPMDWLLDHAAARGSEARPNTLLQQTAATMRVSQ